MLAGLDLYLCCISGPTTLYTVPDTNISGRRYFGQIRATGMDGDDAMWGYGAFCGIPSPSSSSAASAGGGWSPPTETDHIAEGSFTWELAPHGRIETEENPMSSKASTIKNWNVSQSGHNDNNYAKWQMLIQGDDSDSNQISFMVVRKDDKEYAVSERETVLKEGTPAPATTTHVAMGTGRITGSTTGISFKVNEKTTVTDAQLLRILKYDTGLTYTESISGDVPNKTTYALAVKVQVGSGGIQAFKNAHVDSISYVPHEKYRLETEVEDPLAEVKAGEFGEEPYEAMAGFPTTENLYFVNGGTEFAVQIQYEYVKDANAKRKYTQNYTPVTSEAKWHDSGLFEHTGADSKSDPDPSGSKNVVCSQCGFSHKPDWQADQHEAVAWEPEDDGSLTPVSWRWTYHADKEDTLQYTLEWEQAINRFAYAKLKDCKVWRLEEAKVNGIAKLTFQEDTVTAEIIGEAIDAIYNAAQSETAEEGRLYHSLQPENGDNFIFKNLLSLRGCELCYIHNAAEDLIKASQNPNVMYNNTWAISDYLILEETKADLSLLYYEYDCNNTTIPIAQLSVTGNRQDNTYTLVAPEVNFDAVNPAKGTEEAVCQNGQTLYGADIEPDDIMFGGYNGNYSSPSTKYNGKSGYHSGNITLGTQKIFQTGYQHGDAGVVDGFHCAEPQVNHKIASPFRLLYEEIDVHDYDARNGEYNLHDSTAFYRNLIRYGSAPPIYQSGQDPLYQAPGFHLDTTYSNHHTKINNVVVHNPVSTQFAALIPLPKELDQRTDENPKASDLNVDFGTCIDPCEYAVLTCTYTGTHFHTDACYSILENTYVTEGTTGTKAYTTVDTPNLFTAPEAGDYTVTLAGTAGEGTGVGTGGNGATITGTVSLAKDQKVLLGIGRTGEIMANGNGGASADLSTNFVYEDSAAIAGHSTSGSPSLPAGTYYWGPRISASNGQLYRVDYYGSNLNRANFYPGYYYPVAADGNFTDKAGASARYRYLSSNHVQIYYDVNQNIAPNGLEFKVGGGEGVVLNHVTVVEMSHRLMVAGGGGGGGEYGAGANGGNAGYPNGANGGHAAGCGHEDGIGAGQTGVRAQFAIPIANSRPGSGGGGWYAGTKEHEHNGGGGGSSYYTSAVQSVVHGQTTRTTGSATVSWTHRVEQKYKTELLSCREPHHAPNTNWHRYTSGWMHTNGVVCSGSDCTECTNGTPLKTPTGYPVTPTDMSQFYIIQHNGVYHFTHSNDVTCDTCGEVVAFDTYTTDAGKTDKPCVWKVTNTDAPAYDTKASTTSRDHYPFGDPICWKACGNDDNHKKKTDFSIAGTHYDTSGEFVILDKEFELYFPNTGNFYGDGAYGVGQTQNPEGKGYTNAMDTTVWLKRKYVVLSWSSIYKNKMYLAGEAIPLGTYEESTHTWKDDSPANYRYNLRCVLANPEQFNGKIGFYAVAKNAPNEKWAENFEEDRNDSRTYRYAYHDARKELSVDVLGRIGVLNIQDTGDYRFSNTFKMPLTEWFIPNLVRKVDALKQRYVVVDQDNIWGDPISESTKGQNTWGTTAWMNDRSKLLPFALAPKINSIRSLRNQAHRVGYKDYLSLYTIGNYYSENDSGSDYYKVQISPYYYHLNLDTGKWTPLDLYSNDSDEYKKFYTFGSTGNTNEYNWWYFLNWEEENARRNYTEAERSRTLAVFDKYYLQGNGEDYEAQRIKIPSGYSWIQGNAQRLFLFDRTRTFIGSSSTMGANMNPGMRMAELSFHRQAQRYHFTLGLPSSTRIVGKGEKPTSENITKLSNTNGVIVLALDIVARGTTWTIRYDGVPLGEQKLQIMDGGKTYDYGGNPDGPGDKPVVILYSDDKSSRHDLTTEGTH
jgi:hypothetical protein